MQVRIERNGAGVDELVSAVTDAAASVDGIHEPGTLNVLVVEAAAVSR